jgi:hypothetical protein
MSKSAFHQENLARIENHITQLNRKISGFRERLRILEAAERNTDSTYDLLVTLIEHLEVMELRRQLTLREIGTGQIKGNIGCREES